MPDIHLISAALMLGFIYHIKKTLPIQNSDNPKSRKMAKYAYYFHLLVITFTLATTLGLLDNLGDELLLKIIFDIFLLGFPGEPGVFILLMWSHGLQNKRFEGIMSAIGWICILFVILAIIAIHLTPFTFI